MIQKLKSLQSEVELLLESNPRYRDDDAVLICAYYWTKLGKRLEVMSALDFLKLLSTGGLQFPDGITRVRRRLQEKNEHLRGANYLKRKNAETEIRSRIKDL